MNLTVHYLLNGNVETDLRTGVNFRWRVLDNGANVFEHDEQHQIVWAKCYLHPISAEMTQA